MKRKRLAKKAAIEISTALSQNEEAFLDFVNQNNQENGGPEDSGGDESEEFKSDSDSEGDLFLSSSSSKSNTFRNVLDTTSSESSDESWVDWRLRRSAKAHAKAKHRKRKLSRKEKSKMPLHDTWYNKRELKTALAIIKKVMEMEEAEPFNASVDPVTLGFPDYFDVIDAPVDFGTICRNLKTGVKYMNADDVFTDVEYMWENCLRYNKKDTCILNLMTRVKKKFMKYWTAAGLYSERQRITSVNMCYAGYLPVQHLSSAIRPQFRQSLASSYSHPYPIQQIQSSNNQLQFSQMQAACHASAKWSKRGCAIRCNDYVPWCPVDHLLASASQLHSQQPTMSLEGANEAQEPQENVGRLQPSKDFGNAGQAQISVTCFAMKNTSGAPRGSVDPVSGHQDTLEPSEPQTHHLSEHHNEPHNDSQQPAHKERKKGGRGPTRCLFLQDLPEGEKIFVPLNSLGQPVGRDAAKLSSYLGNVARDGHMAPLTYVTWRQMPNSAKEEMWKLVQTKFDIDLAGKDWVVKSLATKWRDWKADLKANHYMPHKSDEERLRDRDPRVLPDQWPVLISFWNSEKAKKQSAINKANREKQKGVHTSGKKSYARIREEERTKRPDGKEPTRAELYVLTHTRKDGQPVDEMAATTISKLLKASKKPRSPEGSGNSDKDTFCQVMGGDRSNWARTNGIRPTPKHSKSRDIMRITLEAKKAAKKDVQKVLENMEALEQRFAHMEAEIAKIGSNVQLLLEKFAVTSTNFVQVRNTPDGAADLQQQHVNSLAASYSFPSQEAVRIQDDAS